MTTRCKAQLTTIAPIVVPLLVILAARLGTYSDWAIANATLAAFLFAWIAADALALGVIAKAPDNKPGLRKLVGAVAAGLLVAIVASSAPVRTALLSVRPVVAAAVGTAAIYLVWSGWLAIAQYRQTRSAQLAWAEVIPARLVRAAASELAMLRIGLLSWNAPVHIPSEATGHAYHRFLTPMLATLVGLQVLELAVVHLLVSLWSETVALVLLVLSIWGLIWLVALMKSFRLFPVLLTKGFLHVRSGTIVDLKVPLSQILGIEKHVDPAKLEAGTTLNLAILTSPNICVALREPVVYRTFFGREKLVDLVALRLDDPAVFADELDERLS